MTRIQHLLITLAFGIFAYQGYATVKPTTLEDDPKKAKSSKTTTTKNTSTELVKSGMHPVVREYINNANLSATELHRIRWAHSKKLQPYTELMLAAVSAKVSERDLARIKEAEASGDLASTFLEVSRYGTRELEEELPKPTKELWKAYTPEDSTFKALDLVGLVSREFFGGVSYSIPLGNASSSPYYQPGLFSNGGEVFIGYRNYIPALSGVTYQISAQVGSWSTNGQMVEEYLERLTPLTSKEQRLTTVGQLRTFTLGANLGYTFFSNTQETFRIDGLAGLNLGVLQTPEISIANQNAKSFGGSFTQSAKNNLLVGGNLGLVVNQTLNEYIDIRLGAVGTVNTTRSMQNQDKDNNNEMMFSNLAPMTLQIQAGLHIRL